MGWGAPVTVTSSRSEVVAIFGPTASGKTAVAELVAAALFTEVVSADALQVYRGLRILTNQPDSPARLVAIRELSREFSVGEYAALAHQEIDQLVAECGVAVVSGGTGLYLRAALVDLELPPPAENGARARWEALYDENPGAAFARLIELDSAAAAMVHRNDRRRVVRALELAEQGVSLVPDRNRLWSADVRRPTIIIGLDVPRDSLERRIQARATLMFERGVVDEVRHAFARPISKTAEKALGLNDLAELPPEQAWERLVVRTRRYAAYQQKWMRRIDGIAMVDGDRPAKEVASEILDLVCAR